MLARLTITLERKENLNVNISSLLQGVLMEWVTAEYAEYLHNCERLPYSQGITFTEESILWEICTLSKDAYAEIIHRVLELNPSTIFLKYKNIELSIKNIKISEKTFHELMEETYFGNCSRNVEIKFLTPTAFKVGGKYQFYPTIRHMFHSLIQKYDTVSSDNEISSQELSEQINKNISIVSYNLRSTFFHLESVKIKSFKGSVGLWIEGPQQFVNLINMLLKFGEYSGIGIKNAIGMGKINVAERERR